MTYALVIANAIQSEGGLPESARRLDTQQWVLGLPTATVAVQQACGYFAVVTTTRPADTPTTTTDRSLTLVGGVPTETWTSRPKTADEILAATLQANADTLRAQADAALATNTAALALPDPTAGNNTYLAIGAPTNAQVTAQVRSLTQQMNAIVAQVRALTAQNNKVIRIALNKFDGTN